MRSKVVFENRRAERGRRIAGAAQEVAVWLKNIAEQYFAAWRELESLDHGGQFSGTVGDIRSQLDWLFSESFMAATPWQWLKHYPRYLSAIVYRLDKARGASSRDHDATQCIRNLWDKWLEQLPEDQRSPEKQAESEFRWMIEELRVSLYAQPLGTAVKVSPQRCEKLLK